MTALDEWNSEGYRIVEQFGDAVTDMFEQLIQGNWVDDNGHSVELNAQMQALKAPVIAAIRYRERIAKELA